MKTAENLPKFSLVKTFESVLLVTRNNECRSNAWGKHVKRKKKKKNENNPLRWARRIARK